MTEPRDRRRFGALLVGFGASGLVLIGLALALVAGVLGDDDGPIGLEGQRQRLVGLLDASSTAMETAGAAAGDADDSLGSTATAARSTAGMMSELSTTLRELASSLRISILGSQPFAPAADDMERVATRAGTVAADLDSAARSVGLTAEDMTTLREDLFAMRRELDGIRTSLARPIDTTGWRLLLGALLTWLAVPALASLALGARWLSRPATATATAARTPPRAAPPV